MEEEINELLEKLIREKVEDCITKTVMHDLVEKVIREVLKNDIINYWQSVTSTNEYFEKKINEILNEPIETNNGWGDRVSYSSFEELFKKTLKSKLDNKYEVANIVEKCVEHKINELIKTQSKELMEKIQAQMTIELAKGIR